MTKENYFFIFLIISSQLIAQKEANIWYFGDHAGLDFNSGTPVALLDGQLSTMEGCATISDNNGSLLFYTDGITVWDKSHNVMLNGNGLLGSDDSTQSALIVPKPNSKEVFYIFTVDSQAGNNGLHYSEVNLTLNGGLGGITANKNINLLTRSTEQITAVVHGNGSDYWVVCHPWDSNKFNSFLITDLGVNLTPVESVTPLMITWPPGSDGTNASVGQLKVSPDGTKLGVVNVTIGTHVADFDNQTGKVSNMIQISTRPIDYGLEFSPSSKLMYVTSQLGNTIDGIHSLFQYNVEAFDIASSEILIAREFGLGYALQLATNKKIYAALGGSGYLGSIESPNIIGTGCNFIFQSVNLNGRLELAGLPPFIQSFFNISTFDLENTCFGDATKFTLNDTVDSVVWDFGDPTSGVNNTSTDLEPTHVFSNLGTYQVSVTATVGAETDTETEIITIYEQPVATKPHDILLCDLVGDITFDLVSHNIFVLNGLDPNVFGVNYYEGMTNYTNGIKIDIPEGYTNASSFFTQEIIAEVYNKQNPECTDITDFNIGIYKTPQLESSANLLSLTQCDDSNSGSDTDGIAEFDLTQQEQYLLLNGVASEVHYNYFTDAASTQPIASPNSFINTQNPQTIYVEGVSNINNQCKTSTSFIVEVLELPTITPMVELKQCDEDLDGFFSAFNLNEVINEITSNTANETVTFYESLADAEQNNNVITNPKTYSNQTSSSDTVWVRVENINGCFRTSQVNLTVTTTQIPSTFIREFYACDDDTDGVSNFDFSSVHSEIEAMFPIGQELIIAYYRNEADALAEENKIDDITNYRNIAYPNTQQIYVRVDSKVDNDCLGLGAHINLYVETQPIANSVVIERECDYDLDGIYSFDTSQVETQLLSGQSLSEVTVTYFDENNNSLTSPLPNPFLTASQTITIRVTNNNVSDGSCFDETTLEFIVDAQPLANPVANQVACDDGIDDTDGFYEFDTSLIENTILNGQTGMEVHYYDNLGAELPSPLPNPFNTSTQSIRVEVVNPINPTCTDTTNIEFIVNPLPDFTVETPQIVCSSDPTFTVVLDPEEKNTNEMFNYEWVYEDGTLLSKASTLTVSTPGTYSVTLTKTDGTDCSRTRDIFVNASELAKITYNDITVVDASTNNTITINLNNIGQGDYEFALDDAFSFYQDAPLFENVSAGIHTLYIRDKKGCGTSSIDISVIGFPKYFTPNGDGVHDFWQIEGVSNSFQSNSDIFIYNRYGKLLKQISPNSKGWDGTFNGNMLPVDDYWFSVSLEDGRIFKGHFALKR
ncbi:T9SS type B sorting domain-containing protein [Wocania ichthyoenteri]|uniref:T9SS type B sorting domain-containing protein n=1 Tax=Wocania ichthyoenteri TaxID=1230531 RepID=UPI000690FC36|nr:T9SS type B sorting domain-containing protein [Wocania ichthyoenteri]